MDSYDEFNLETLPNDELFLILDTLRYRDIENLKLSSRKMKYKVELYHYLKTSQRDDFDPEINYTQQHMSKLLDYDFTKIMIDKYNLLSIIITRKLGGYRKHIIDTIIYIEEIVDYLLKIIDDYISGKFKDNLDDVENLYQYRSHFVTGAKVDKDTSDNIRTIISDIIYESGEIMIDDQITNIYEIVTGTVPSDSNDYSERFEEIVKYLLSYVLWILNRTNMIDVNIYGEKGKRNRTTGVRRVIKIDDLDLDNNNLDRIKRLTSLGIDASKYYE